MFIFKVVIKYHNFTILSSERGQLSSILVGSSGSNSSSSLGFLENAPAVEDDEDPDKEGNDVAKEQEPPQEQDAKVSDEVANETEGEGLEASTTFSLVGVANDSTER